MVKLLILLIMSVGKMKYQVNQDGKPCAEYNIGDWNVDTFSTLKEAIIFAFHWAYPYPYEMIVENVSSGHPDFQLQTNTDYDLSMGETPVIIRINEIEE